MTAMPEAAMTATQLWLPRAGGRPEQLDIHRQRLAALTAGIGHCPYRSSMIKKTAVFAESKRLGAAPAEPSRRAIRSFLQLAAFSSRLCG
jgi:hypothetical protein